MQLTHLSLSLLAAALIGPALAADAVSAAKTDVGSILKTMDQAKLKIPPEARAVMKKMPETPAAVTTEDRKAIKDCIANTQLDKLAIEACTAQNDQLTVLLDKKRVSNANMQKFVASALAAGGKMEAEKT
jgi:hypothetical protein